MICVTTKQCLSGGQHAYKITKAGPTVSHHLLNISTHIYHRASKIMSLQIKFYLLH